MQRKNLVAALAAVALAGTALGGPAVADAPSAKPTTRTLAGGLVSPLSLDVTDDGTLYYSQNFAGSLHRKKPGKAPKAIYTAPVPGTEVGAVSERNGSLRFALTLPPEGEETPPVTVLMGIGDSGKPKALANLSAYEENRNPDGDVTYGFRSLPEGCEVPPFLQAYDGIVESHPYATLQTKRRTYIADAAGNDILKLGRNGNLSTVAVLPAQPLLITEAVREALNTEEQEVLPECTLGRTAHLEPVPTDVEKGPDGKLYVTTLPGGPEIPGGASVYRVDPKTGKTKKVVSGLSAATGLAVADNGRIFVAELFGGRIAKAKPGEQPRTFLGTELPGDVELRSNGDVYATTHVLVGPQGPEDPTPPGGRVVRIRR